MNINQQQFDLLKSRHVARAAFTIGNVTFGCREGEWKVTKNRKCVDVFTFRLYEEEELKQELNKLGINTDQLRKAKYIS